MASRIVEITLNSQAIWTARSEGGAGMLRSIASAARSHMRVDSG